MEQLITPKGEKAPRKEYKALRGISTRRGDFEPGETVVGLSDDICRLYLKRGYIKKGK